MFLLYSYATSKHSLLLDWTSCRSQPIRLPEHGTHLLSQILSAPTYQSTQDRVESTDQPTAASSEPWGYAVQTFKAVKWAVHVNVWGLSVSSAPSSLPSSSTMADTDATGRLNKSARLDDAEYMYAYSLYLQGRGMRPLRCLMLLLDLAHCHGMCRTHIRLLKAGYRRWAKL
jgi:hypothetical protein